MYNIISMNYSTGASLIVKNAAQTLSECESIAHAMCKDNIKHTCTIVISHTESDGGKDFTLVDKTYSTGGGQIRTIIN